MAAKHRGTENGPRRAKITLTEIRALPPNKQISDFGPGAVPGFGARRRAGNAVSYFVMYRTAEGRQRLFTIGGTGRVVGASNYTVSPIPRRLAHHRLALRSRPIRGAP
jgi:hypothetical protein